MVSAGTVNHRTSDQGATSTSAGEYAIRRPSRARAVVTTLLELRAEIASG